MKYYYQTKGTCSRVIEVEINKVIVESVRFEGGCHGNLQGISSLVRGMKVEDVIRKLDGIRCGVKSTSCPDQLCRALEQAMQAQ